MSHPEGIVQIIKCDCPGGEEPNYQNTLVASKAIYFWGGGKYYKFNPEVDVIPGYAVCEETDRAVMVLPNLNIVFIGKRVDFVDGFMGYSVFEVDPEIADQPDSGMIQVTGPLRGYLSKSTKNSQTKENASEIILGHIRFMHLTKGKNMFLTVNMCKDYSFGISDENALEVDEIIYLNRDL